MNIDFLKGPAELLAALENDMLRGDILLDCRKRIIGYLRNQLPPEDAEDLASDCIVALQCGGLEKWTRGKLSTFAISIARNKLFEFWRRRKRQPLSISPVAELQDEIEDRGETALEMASAPGLTGEDHFRKHHPVLFSHEYAQTWQEILRICESVCFSPHEKEKVSQLNSRMCISPEKTEAFLAVEASGGSWPEMDFSPSEKALVLRLFLRMGATPAAINRQKATVDGAEELLGEPDAYAGSMGAARFRAEVWRYWAKKSTAATGATASIFRR